jgi:hypothetical protein
VSIGNSHSHRIGYFPHDIPEHHKRSDFGMIRDHPLPVKKNGRSAKKVAGIWNEGIESPVGCDFGIRE